MSFLKIIRSNEWWEYKIPPLLALAYATILKTDTPIKQVSLWLLVLMVAIAIGAVYVSVINDITDLKEDVASGKKNRISGVPRKYRWMLPVICIAIGCYFLFFFYPDYLSCLLYLLPWISFSLYSFEPFRLKKRGFWGVIADACGSHLFISLFIVASITRFTSQQMDWLWFVSVGVWSFIYGLRGILWHQFYDRENDLKVKLNTFATNINPVDFRIKEISILLIEIVALLLVLLQIDTLITFVFLFFYALTALVRWKRLGQKPVIILAPSNQPYQLILMDFYQLFLPLSLIISSIIRNPYDVIFVAVHLVLFPGRILALAKDMLRVLNQ